MTATFKADGKRRAVIGAPEANKTGGWQEKAPIGSKGSIPAGSDLISAWPTRFTSLALSNLTESCRPFSAYVAALQTSGAYQVKTQKRQMAFQGHNYTSYRIVIERSPALAAKSGAYKVEMVFDGTYRLPVTIRTNSAGTKGVPTDILWTARWMGGKNYSKETFALPAKKT